MQNELSKDENYLIDLVRRLEIKDKILFMNSQN